MSTHNNEKRINELSMKYEQWKQSPFQLAITRGVPSKEQLQLSEPLLNVLSAEDLIGKGNTDYRNYGGLTGIPEAKQLFGNLFGTTPEETIVGGNSSLQLMYILLNSKMNIGDAAWKTQGKVTFLCPSPGYDRHFQMTEHFGIRMLPVDLNDDGPDMDQVEKLVAEDESVKGIWCVPTYSNPTGITYSDEVVDRLAAMETKSRDFIVIWDNAYMVHHLNEEKEQAKNFLEACKKAGNPNRAWMFTSTSKITFPGAGVAAVSASEENVSYYTEMLSKQLISFDKINQMRHVKFLKDRKGIEDHMKKHAEILRPKFDMIEQKLNEYFQGEKSGLVEWTTPNGGYFVHLTTKKGCASKIVRAAEDIGIQLTPANATYPYGHNPEDNSIRLAPTSVPAAELEQAMEALSVCIEWITLQ